MGTFTGTNMPPILRLGGSGDVAFCVRNDTSIEWLPKETAIPTHIIELKSPVLINVRKTTAVKKLHKGRER
jgi:hypothetical protein